MATFLACLFGILACLALLLFIQRDQRKIGQSIERERQNREALSDAKEANAIRDRVVADREYRDGVRKRFQRD